MPVLKRNHSYGHMSTKRPIMGPPLAQAKGQQAPATANQSTSPISGRQALKATKHSGLLLRLPAHLQRPRGNYEARVLVRCRLARTIGFVGVRSIRSAAGRACVRYCLHRHGLRRHCFLHSTPSAPCTQAPQAPLACRRPCRRAPLSGAFAMQGQSSNGWPSLARLSNLQPKCPRARSTIPTVQGFRYSWCRLVAHTLQNIAGRPSK